jgi:hypothetical protein
MNHSVRALLVFLLLSATGLAGQPAAAPLSRPTPQDEADRESDSFVFQLLPNSLSKNPRLAMSFVTEMTDSGRRLPAPTVAQPAYYLAQAGGYRQLGDGAPAGEKVPPPVDIQKLMQDALGRAGYLPADAQHPATLVVIFHWGSYSTPTEEPGAVPVSVVVKNHQLLERAALVGGETYSRALEKALIEASALADTTGPARVNDVTGQRVTDSAFGDASGYFSDVFNPISLFLSKSPRNRELFELAAGSCYYVIASAYDAGAVARKQRLLLWRTKMSVAADGVSLADTIRPMIVRSPRFLGRETDGAVILSRRLHEGRVKLGELDVLGYDEKKLPTPPKQDPVSVEPAEPAKRP